MTAFVTMLCFRFYCFTTTPLGVCNATLTYDQLQLLWCKHCKQAIGTIIIAIITAINVNTCCQWFCSVTLFNNSSRLLHTRLKRVPFFLSFLSRGLESFCPCWFANKSRKATRSDHERPQQQTLINAHRDTAVVHNQQQPWKLQWHPEVLAPIVPMLSSLSHTHSLKILQLPTCHLCLLSFVLSMCACPCMCGLYLLLKYVCLRVCAACAGSCLWSRLFCDGRRDERKTRSNEIHKHTCKERCKQSALACY